MRFRPRSLTSCRYWRRSLLIPGTEFRFDFLDRKNSRDHPHAIEGFEDNSAILKTLEDRYNDIRSGLDKIKHGTYGICQVCGKEIEVERLEANPSARTCKEHIDQV